MPNFERTAQIMAMHLSFDSKKIAAFKEALHKDISDVFASRSKDTAANDEPTKPVEDDVGSYDEASVEKIVQEMLDKVAADEKQRDDKITALEAALVELQTRVDDLSDQLAAYGDGDETGETAETKRTE